MTHTPLLVYRLARAALAVVGAVLVVIGASSPAWHRAGGDSAQDPVSLLSRY